MGPRMKVVPRCRNDDQRPYSCVSGVKIDIHQRSQNLKRLHTNLRGRRLTILKSRTQIERSLRSPFAGRGQSRRKSVGLKVLNPEKSKGGSGKIYDENKKRLRNYNVLNLLTTQLIAQYNGTENSCIVNVKGNPANKSVKQTKMFKPQTTVPKPFHFATEARARFRQIHDGKFEGQRSHVTKLSRIDAERRAQDEQKALAKMRKILVHKAKPFVDVKPFQIKRSARKPTIPRSPKLGHSRRLNSV